MEDVDLDRIEALEQQVEILEIKLAAEEKSRKYFERLYTTSVEVMNMFNLPETVEEWDEDSYSFITKTPVEAIERIKSTYVKGQHLELFERLIKENSIVEHGWNQFLVALRLSGYDDPQTGTLG